MTLGSGNHIVDEKDAENALPDYSYELEEEQRRADIREFNECGYDYMKDAFIEVRYALKEFVQARNKIARLIDEVSDTAYNLPTAITRCQKADAEGFEEDYIGLLDTLESEFKDCTFPDTTSTLDELDKKYGID